MVRILIICRSRTLFSMIQASIQSIVFYHANTVEEGASAIHSASPDLVCIALSTGEARPGNIQHLQSVPGRKHKIPFLFLLEKEFNFQTSAIPGKNSFIISDNRFNAERFISSVFSLIYQNREISPLYIITDNPTKTLPESTGESICDPGAYAKSFLIGTSSAIQFVRRNLCKFAPFPDEVLIFGESGTGKELAAKILHNLSGRGGPFISINCAALPQNLAEAELFGYEKGAFTDAKQNHRGVFEQAHKGTLFLDEVGEMQEILQPKLLRILENDTIVRLGSAVQRKVNVRILSATNADIDIHSDNPRIRRDLLFRLNSLSIYIPPLRERREDIASLSEWFLSRQSLPATLSKRSRHLLTEYDWPGNVRQLFGLLRKGIIYSGSDLRSKKTVIEITPEMFNPKEEYELQSVQYPRG
ncbi:MAG: sigma-54-dependent Fis family transcriptional regulator [Bacteroidetes bacterium]|nr:sigma-54-dependent Fis family transcriptional regulator [Bacteroidota bacterium]